MLMLVLMLVLSELSLKLTFVIRKFFGGIIETKSIAHTHNLHTINDKKMQKLNEIKYVFNYQT